MNPATEATLEELLKAFKAFGADVEKMRKLAEEAQKASGTGGTGTTNASSNTAKENLNILSKGFSVTSMALGVMEGAINVVSGLISGLSSVIGGLIGTAVKLGESLFKFSLATMEGKARLSDLFSAMSVLPSFFGTFFSLASQVQKYFEGLLDQYRGMTRSGASFSGSLSGMRLQAYQSGLTLDEFSKIIKSNSETFSTIGGTVQQGIDRFASAASLIMAPNGQFSKQLSGLGYTAEDAGTMLATVMKNAGAMTGNNTVSAKQLANATTDYALTLDQLSKLTGKRRDQLDAEVKKAEEDQLWQVYLDSLTFDDRQKAEMLDVFAKNMGGQGMSDTFRANMRGAVIAQTEASQNFARSTNGMGLDIQRVQGLMGMSYEDAKKGMVQFGFDVSKAARELVDSVGTVGQASGVLAFVPGELVALSRKGAKINYDATQYLADATREEARQKLGQAQSMAESEQAVRRYGAKFGTALIGLFAPILPQLEKWGFQLLGVLSSIVTNPVVIQAISDAINWVVNLVKVVKDAFDSQGIGGAIRAFIFKTIEGIGKVWDVVKDPLIAGFKSVWESMKPPMLALWHDLVVKTKPYIEHLFQYMGDRFDDMLDKLLSKIPGFSDVEGTSKKVREKEEDILKLPEFEAYRKAMMKNATEHVGTEKDPRQIEYWKRIVDIFRNPEANRHEAASGYIRYRQNNNTVEGSEKSFKDKEREIDELLEKNKIGLFEAIEKSKKNRIAAGEANPLAMWWNKPPSEKSSASPAAIKPQDVKSVDKKPYDDLNEQARIQALIKAYNDDPMSAQRAYDQKKKEEEKNKKSNEKTSDSGERKDEVATNDRVNSNNMYEQMIHHLAMISTHTKDTKSAIQSLDGNLLG